MMKHGHYQHRARAHNPWSEKQIHKATCEATHHLGFDITTTIIYSHLAQ